jgi:hypothetical protein
MNNKRKMKKKKVNVTMKHPLQLTYANKNEGKELYLLGLRTKNPKSFRIFLQVNQLASFPWDFPSFENESHTFWELTHPRQTK